MTVGCEIEKSTKDNQNIQQQNVLLFKEHGEETKRRKCCINLHKL